MASNPARQLIKSFDAEKIKVQLRKWQERLLDLTKSNPLLGLNRSRVSKLRIIAPLAGELFKSFVLEEAELRMPLVRRRARTALPLLDGGKRNNCFRSSPATLSSTRHRRTCCVVCGAFTTMDGRPLKNVASPRCF
jgi:hypothetical protein